MISRPWSDPMSGGAMFFKEIIALVPRNVHYHWQPMLNSPLLSHSSEFIAKIGTYLGQIKWVWLWMLHCSSLLATWDQCATSQSVVWISHFIEISGKAIQTKWLAFNLFGKDKDTKWNSNRNLSFMNTENNWSQRKTNSVTKNSTGGKISATI